MRTSRLSIALLATLLTASCTYDFGLDGLPDNPRLVLHCLPCAGRDTTVLQLSASQPVAPGADRSELPSSVAVSFVVNGVEQEVRRATDSLPGVPSGCFYVTGRRAEGDEVSVRAEARGLPAAQARTSLPAAFPLVGLERRLKQGVYRSEQFRITFRDRPDTADYYGLRIVRRTVFGRLSFGQESTRYEVLSLDVENEPLLNGRNGLDAALNLPNDFYGNLYIWDDSRLQSREYTLCVETNYMEDWDPDEWNGQYQRFAYKVLLYTLSPELYRYLRSLNANDNNDLGHTGLAPMRSNYTNVDGGIGVLGGCHLTETDWLDSLLSE